MIPQLATPHRENSSKYIQQLRELRALFEMGELTDKEFTD